MAPRREVEFHNRIKLLRIERGLSRQQLATLVNVHPQTIGYIERRQYNPTLAVALKLSDALGVGLDAIFSQEPFDLLTDQALRRTNA